jgi:hypothetical protein
MLIKFKAITSYLISIIVVLFGLGILFLVSIPLFPKEVNEINKQRVIGMQSSSPMEFDNKKEFWWMVRGGNSLVFHNSSDEIIVGMLILEFEANPCKYNEIIAINLNNENNKYKINLNEFARISVPLEIESKGERILNVKFTNARECVLSNGDPRDFGAKLIRWAFL